MVACCLGVAALGSGGNIARAAARAAAAPRPAMPTVLLYPASPTDVAALVDLRNRLRVDGRMQVLTYSPDSATVVRAAAEQRHPEWVGGGLLSDDARLALARALGVTYYVLVSPGRDADSTHLQLVETAPPARIFDWYGVNREYGARALESQSVPNLPSGPTLMASAAPLAAELSDVDPPLPTAVPPPLPAVAPPPHNITPSAPTPVAPVAAAPVAAAPVAAAPPFAFHAHPPKSLPGVQMAMRPALTLPELPLTVPEVAPAPVPLVVVPAPPVVPVPEAVTSEAPLAIPVPAPQPEIVPVIVPAPDRSTASVALGPAAPVADSEPASVAPAPRPEDLTEILPLMTRGDTALEGGDIVGAISDYRQAVNGAPRSAVPRLRLAQAYQRGGLSEKALDEGKRALDIAPDSLAVQQFLTQLDAESGTSDGSITRYQALVGRTPDDPAAHAALAEALWNGGDLAGAEAEYKESKKLSSPSDHTAAAQLARLYAAQARYDDCLGALQDAGSDGYILAIKIVKGRVDNLSSTIEASRAAFEGGKSTREQFYDGAKTASAQADALAGFVDRVTPPAEFKLSHLHRKLSADLLAQEAATLKAFIETGDSAQSAAVSRLEKATLTEMLTAQAAEEGLGLWRETRVGEK